MKVAIKFCGGCDPTYDRVEVFRQIESLAGASIEWVRVEEQVGESVLLICGCPKACPGNKLQHVSNLVSVTHNGVSAARVVAQLLGKGQSSANPDQR